MNVSGPGLRLALLGTALSVACGRDAAPVPHGRPNILLIVADDLGYADLGAYGSDIRTPHIDALAASGVLFTQFHTAPMCAPTRAMLLTGNNNHVAGMGQQGASGALQRVPGYEGHLSDRVAPLPRLLRAAGYHTYMAGKWHLGDAVEYGPGAAGFEQSFVLVHGGANHFNDVGFFDGGSVYRENDRRVDYPAGRYSTELYTDRLIAQIDARRDDGRPFFAYAAYTSPHWPLQVPDAELDRYAGRYDAGYDVLRERRFASLKRAGIIAESSAPPPRNDAITPWTSLTPDEHRHEARKMELYAAMVENLDHHIGRLLAWLDSTGLRDNTLIVFMSDNGAAGEDFYNTGPYVPYIRQHYDNTYANMGRARSWVSYGPPWAEAGSAPFSGYKGYAREGGIVAPMIVSGAGTARQATIDAAYVTVMDIAPTLLEVAGAAYPVSGKAAPVLGESMVRLLAGESTFVHDSTYVTALYHGGRALLRRGRWKLVNLEPPFSEASFALFDIERDPGETSDVAATQREVHAALLETWRLKLRELSIVLPGELQAGKRP